MVDIKFDSDRSFDGVSGVSDAASSANVGADVYAGDTTASSRRDPGPGDDDSDQDEDENEDSDENQQEEDETINDNPTDQPTVGSLA